MGFIKRWFCRHGFHAWELWVSAYGEREVCAWCGRVNRHRA